MQAETARQGQGREISGMAGSGVMSNPWALAKNYQYADWNAAFRRAVREDWAGLRNGAPTATGAPGGRRKGQTMIEHMMESHARMDALLDAKDAEKRAANALSAETTPLEEVSYVRH
jgi:hypothetical protein